MIEDGDNPDAPFVDYRLKGSALPEPEAAPARKMTMQEKRAAVAEMKRLRFGREANHDRPKPMLPRKRA